ncbi:MAG: glycosyltransferase family 2 protein [Patescibacteria group bacterium]
MKVSVIIPVYNEEDVIKECLKSLIKQSFENFEVIIVDDGSTDKTLNIVNKINLKGLKLSIIEQNHQGTGTARNLGAKKARGEILVFVDADMTFDKYFLEKLIEPIVEGKSKGTFSKEEYVSNWENVWARCWNINEGWEDRKRHPKNYPDRQKVFRAILKKEFDRVGGFTPGGYDDDWSLGIKLGFDAVDVEGAKFYHQNPASFSEIFKQAKWIGKREYKFGLIGSFIALLRASLPVSIIIGFSKFIAKGEPAFLFFKIVYDLGIFIGILEHLQGNQIK